MSFAEFMSTFTFSLFLIFPHRADAGNCDGIKYITIEDARRSTAYNGSRHSGKLLCDRDVIKDGSWYRFSSEVGGEMPTTPPNWHHCGTYAPIWMNGTHPTVEEGKVSRQACVKSPFRLPINCSESYDISVLNCSDYYIYQLKEPQQCSLAYCAGSKAPNCTVGEKGSLCPENFRPYFTMTTKIFHAIENSELLVQISARDPEAQPLKYSVLSNGTIKPASIDRNDQLKVVTNKSGSVHVMIEDDVGSQSILVLQIITKHCHCKNGGICLWGKLLTSPVNPPTYTCSCIKPYTGELCQTISDAACDNLPCFPGLKCTATADGYSCEECPKTFEGDGTNCKLKPFVTKITVQVEMTIIGGLVWRDELKNKSSLDYKKTTAEITGQIKSIYANVAEFIYILVHGYRRGSVIVEFELVFTKEIHDPLESLEHYTKKNGKLGNLIVDPKKLKEKENHPVSSGGNKIFGVNKTTFIVVMVIVSLLAISAIVAVAICLKKKNVRIVMFSWGDDHAEMCPNVASPRAPSPSRNQVVDITFVENKVFMEDQYHKQPIVD